MNRQTRGIAVLRKTLVVLVMMSAIGLVGLSATGRAAESILSAPLVSNQKGSDSVVEFEKRVAALDLQIEELRAELANANSRTAGSQVSAEGTISFANYEVKSPLIDLSRLDIRLLAEHFRVLEVQTSPPPAEEILDEIHDGHSHPAGPYVYPPGN